MVAGRVGVSHEVVLQAKAAWGKVRGAHACSMTVGGAFLALAREKGEHVGLC